MTTQMEELQLSCAGVKQNMQPVNTDNITNEVKDDDESDDEISLALNRSSKCELRAKRSNCNEGEATNHDNAVKAKPKKNRELEKLEDSAILTSRLRSNSGKLYSTSVSVEAGSRPTSPIQALNTIEEETENLEMCPKEKCCQGTEKLIEMISSLKKSVDGVLKKVTDEETVALNTRVKVDEIEEKCEQNANEIDDVYKELKDTQHQLDIVSNIVIKQDQQISFLKQRILEIQQRETAANIIITGIPETKQEKPLQLFNTFVQEGLKLSELIPANKAFRIGVGQNRPLVVELRHAENKKKNLCKCYKAQRQGESEGRKILRC